MKTLSRAMQLGNLGIQVVPVSRKAFEAIEFTGYEIAEASVWYPLKMERDDEARSLYKRIRNEKWKPGELYVMQIMEQEVGNDDARLRPDITT